MDGIKGLEDALVIRIPRREEHGLGAALGTTSLSGQRCQQEAVVFGLLYACVEFLWNALVMATGTTPGSHLFQGGCYLSYDSLMQVVNRASM